MSQKNIVNLVKDELTEIKITSPCCKRAFLSGVIRGAGSFYVNHEGFGIILTHPAEALMSKCAYMVRGIVGYEPTIIMREKSREVGQKVLYELNLSGDRCFDLLEEAYISPAPYRLYEGIAPELIEDDCCKKAFLRGLFLASGTMSVPSRTTRGTGSYYLDMVVSGETVADDLVALCDCYELTAKKRVRNDIFSVYIKDAEKISDFCVLVGAINGMLELQDIIATRSLHNTTNRQTNCTSANIDKTVEAGLKQTVAIRLIEQKLGLDSLEAQLRLTAEARLAHPEMSLAELANLLPNNPSKSCLNHRFRKLLAIAETLE